MLEAIIAALIQVLPTTALGILGYVVTRQNLENSWRQTLDSIGREFWNNSSVKRIRCAVAYPKAYIELKNVLHKRYKIDLGEDIVELEQDEYEILDDLDKFLTLLEGAALSSPILRDKLSVWSLTGRQKMWEVCVDGTLNI